MAAAGYEVFESKDNFNYSRSFLYGYGTPFTVTGVRATMPLIMPQLTVQAALLTGTDIVFDNNPHNTFGFNSTLTLDRVIASATLYSGIESATGTGVRTIVDGTVTVIPTTWLKVGGNGTYGYEAHSTASTVDASWYGVAGYVRAELPYHFFVATRAEYFADPQGLRTASAGGTFIEATGTAGWTLSDHAQLRTEYRHDWVNAGDLPSANTATLGIMAWF